MKHIGTVFGQPMTNLRPAAQTPASDNRICLEIGDWRFEIGGRFNRG
jgi:hypothetical protein